MRMAWRWVLAGAVAMGVGGIFWLTDAPVAAGSDDISVVVRSASGPEAGVWVIAETNDLETGFRKIVVTDDAGRFMVPDLPVAAYEVWVRGYGLVDSYKTPARLKFMKSERSENNAIIDVTKRLAMANPQTRFRLVAGEREVFDLIAQGSDSNGKLARLRDVMGDEFSDNAIHVDLVREGVALSGFAALPTLNRANSTQQFLFVNNRPVKDKQLTGAVRGAYMDFLARNRHPAPRRRHRQ